MEGILHDDTDSRQSVAILNGTLVKTGDSYGPYKILSITSDAVLGIHEKKGKQVRWMPAAKAPDSPQIFKMKAVRAKEARPDRQDQPKENTLPAKSPFSWNPLELLSSAVEMQAISDAHQIHRAVLMYHQTREEAGIVAPDFKQLVDGDFLSAGFVNGTKGKYRFTITASRSGFEINADPLDPAAKLRHFYIGQDGVLREERGAKAQAQSPEHEY